MKRIITSALCLALACTFVAKTAAQGSPMQPFDPQAASQATAAASLPEALKVKTFTLSNGMTVWINEDHSQPKVFGAVVVNAGAKDCPETGIAHYFEHMMFKGTEKIGTIDYEAEKPYLDSIAVKYDELAATTDDEERQAIQMEINRLNIAASDYAIPNEFNNLITECGGSGLNAYTSMDVTVYHNEFVSSYLEQWAELNSERLIDPVFRLFQSELETVYEEKNMSANNPLSAFSELIFTEGFKGTPYGFPIIGTTEYLKNPRLNQMKEFFEKYYVASNMGLMLTGDINAESALPVLEKTFGRIRQGEPNRVEPMTIDYNGRKEITALAKMPVIKINLLCYRAPSQKDPDYLPMCLISYLMNNSEGTGLLDKLMTSHKMAEIECMFPGTSFNESGIFPFLYVPKLVGQSNKKAEKILMGVLDDIKSGDFDESLFESCKQSYRRELLSSLERTDDRMSLMVNAFSQGRKWEDVIAEADIIDNITKDDIVKMANKYFNDDYLIISKKFGDPEQDNLQKPPYKSVVPANRTATSAYAAALREQAEAVVPPMPVVDFDNDAVFTAITPNVSLYSVENPLNDIFNIDIKYKVGTTAMPELERAIQYVSLLGTDEMSFDEHRKALQEIGGTLGCYVSPNVVTISISGFEDKFEETLSLVADFINAPAADSKSLKIIKDNETLSNIMNKRDAGTISDALVSYALHKDGSPYLQDKGKISSKFLLDACGKVKTYACDICYSGSIAPEKVADALKSKFQFEKSTVPFKMYDGKDIVLENKPVIYFVNKAKASQSDINALVAGEKLLDIPSRYTSYAFGSYLGGGMGSLMFQEIREFRSFAYSAQAAYNKTNYSRREIDPTFLRAYVGTQGDKTIDAMAVVDSLIRQTPFDAGKVDRLRKELRFEEITSYPDFRGMADHISGNKNSGYSSDPIVDFFKVIDTLDADSLESFWKQHVDGKNIVWTIVGDKKRIDMEALSKFGEIKEIQVKDIIK